jgi:hypothetical protein
MQGVPSRSGIGRVRVTNRTVDEFCRITPEPNGLERYIARICRGSRRVRRRPEGSVLAAVEPTSGVRVEFASPCAK